MDDARDSIAQLTPAQRAQLEARLRDVRSPPSQARTISARADRATWPLSAAQMRLWTLSRLRHDDPLYNIQRAWRLQGSVDRSVLEASFGEIMRRHEALRARFTDHAGSPVQDIRPFTGFKLSVESTHDGDDDERFGYARRVARAEAEQAFDLAGDTLVRVRLVELDREDHVLMLTAHHLVCDGWSMDVIEREFTAIYPQCLQGAQPSLDPLPVQYADFAVWQEARRRGPAGQRDLDFWESQLEGPVTPLQVPGRSRQHGTGAPVGGHIAVTLDRDVSAAVKEFSRVAKVTPFMTLLTGFQLALHATSGDEDMVLCSPAAGRVHVETEPLVGYFNNLVVLRGDLSGDPTVHQLLERNRKVVLEAFDHQGAAFQDVASLPSVASVPLARGVFVLQETSHSPLRIPGVSVTPFAVEAATADFEFAVFMREVEGEYRSVVRFHRNLFATDKVEALMSRLDSVLRDMIAEPERHRSQLVPREPGVPEPSAANASGEQSGASPDKSRPRTLLETQLMEIWERVFKTSPISVDDDFFDLGGHSLLAAELIAEIERNIVDEPLPLATLFRAPTIATLADVLATGGWSESWASLVPIQPNGSRPPLFFVHAHGGNVLGYRDLAKHLGNDQPFYGLQAPEMNLEGADVESRDLEAMAAQYLEELRTVQRHGPYLLGGWCLGGDVAFEMAHQLTGTGEEVAMVVMIDNPRPEFLAPELTAHWLHRRWNRVRTRLSMEWSNLAEVSWSDKPRFVVERVSRLAGSGFVGIETLVAKLVPIPHSRAYRRERIVAAHEKAYEAYHPRRYSGPVTLVRAEQQPFGRSAESSLGWNRYVEGDVDVIEAPGHRVGLLSEPRVRVVAEQVRGSLAKGLGDQEVSAS